MSEVLARIRVLLTNVVAWLIVAATVIVIIVEEIAPFDHLGAVGTAITVLTHVGTVIAVLVAVIRRVTPVLAAERGLLPSRGWNGTQTEAADKFGTVQP